MTSTLPLPSPRSTVLAVITLGAALALVVAYQLAARATHDVVTLSGTLAADDFLIAVDETDDSRLLLCAEACFTRARSEIGTIVVDGFDGDDTLTVNHGAGLVSNTDGTLTVSFNAGPGADHLGICTAGSLAPCTSTVATSVAPGASVDERVLAQSTAGRSLTITTNDVATIQDRAPGALTVTGTETADQITYREAADLPRAGEIAVGAQAPYRFGAKTTLVVDSAGGPDQVAITTAEGLAGTAASCSPAGAPAAQVCVRSDGAADDTLTVSGAAADGDQVSLLARAAGASSLTGLSATAGLDLAGIDGVELSLQSAEDSLSVATTSAADTVMAATTPSGLVLTGNLATDATAFPLPRVDLSGDGTAPLDVTLDSGDGDDGDRLELATTATDDVLALGPTDNDGTNEVPDTGCTTAFSTCLEVTPDGRPGLLLTLRGLQQHQVQAGAGDDTLTVVGDLAASTTWRGGEGADGVNFLGTGPALAVDFESSSIQQDGAGPVTATGTERLDVDAAGGSVTTTGTASADDLTFRPTAPGAGSVALAGHPMQLGLTGVGGADVLDPAGGDDRVTIEGSTAADRFAVGRTTSLSVAVDDRLPIRVEGTEEARLSGLGGDDEFNVTGAGGPATLTADGGADASADTVTFAVATTDAEVSIDDDLGTGQIAAGGPAIGLHGVEQIDVEGDGAHVLTVRGSDAADTLAQRANNITVGHTTDVTFSRFPGLVLAGGAADDQLWLAPEGTNGVSAVTADGDTENDTMTVVGTALSERISYTPSGENSGAVELPGAPPVTFTGIEDTGVDGSTAPPSGDTLVVATPAHQGTLRLEPGATFDSGTVHFLDVSGSSTTAAPLHFGGLGRGGVEFAGDVTAPADRVVLTGRPDDDVITVATRNTLAGDEAVVTLDQQLPVAVPGAHTLVLDGRDGVDTFRIPTDHPLPGVSGPGIEVRAGGPDTGDRLDLTGGGGELTADLAGGTVGETGHAATRHTGVERIDVDAAGQPLRVVGGGGPDSAIWQPTGPAAGSVTEPGGPTMHAESLGTIIIDPRAGADHVSVAFRSVVDTVTVTRADTTEVGADGLQPVLLSPQVESLAVATGDSADTVRVVGAGGPGVLAVDGGQPTAGSDVLRLESADATVSYATDPTSGRLDSPGGAVDFTAIETVDVAGTGTGELRVNGTDGADTFTIGESAGPRISVDEAAAVTYTGYPDVVLDGHGGNDDVTVGYRSLDDIIALDVTGGAGADDQVTVADTVGTTRTVTVRPLTATSGIVDATGLSTTLTVGGSEAVALNGRGGDDSVQVVTPAGSQQVQVTPGATADAGSVRVASLLPLTFSQLGADGTLTTTDTAGIRDDTVTLHGSAVSETFTLAGESGEVRLTGWVPLLPLGALDLSIRGGDGSDAVTISGPVPYRSTVVDGGAPDLGDSLNAQGPTSAVTVDLADATITGYGGVISFPGVVDLHTDLGGRPLTQVGTPADDAMCYDPMAPRDGRLYIVGAPGGGTTSSVCLPDQRGTNVLHTFVDVGHLTVDPAGGSDEVIVNGTTSRDLVSIHALAPTTEVTVHPEPDSGSTFRLPVHVLVASTESLVAAADNGSDSVDVTTYDSAAPLITVHGEGPATMRIADDLVVRDGTGGAHLHDTHSHTKGSGTVTAEYTKGSGAIIRVDYTGMEDVTLNRDPKAGD